MKSLASDRQRGKVTMLAPSMPAISALLRPWSLPLLLVLVLSLLVGSLAYQAPPNGHVRVGWLGDQLFLDSSGGLGNEAVERGDFYPDELTTDSPTSRSRWTRQHARLVLPNLGAGSDLRLTMLVQGWPADAVVPAEARPQRATDTAQPLVTLQADGSVIASFMPTPQWDTYHVAIPASVRSGADLSLTIDTSATFADTARSSDPRPKGIRLALVEVITPASDPTALLPPAWKAVGMLILAALLLYILLLQLLRSATLSFLLTTFCIGAAGAGLALVRIWMGAALSVALCVLGVALLLAWQQPLLAWFRALLRRYTRGRALNYGLVTTALAWLGLMLSRGASELARNELDLGIVRSTFPDSLLFGLLGMGLLALVFVLGREGLPRVSDGIANLLNGRRAAPIILLLLGGIWLSYETMVILTLPYVGHADYADNAVVARNLIAGRGWVVDYVTQFYRLYESTTHPQETWPLLQPVWIAPFLLLFGPEAWAAKIPNLLFNALLLLLIYTIGSYLWSRRVGLTAAVLTLTNHLFFNLTIYTTSDLGFVLFSLAAIYLLYLAVEAQEPWAAADAHELAALPDKADTDEQHEPDSDDSHPSALHWPFLIGSGIWTGLMMLQKPSGATIAVGMGLWLMSRTFSFNLAALRRMLLGFGLWAALALLVLSPYLVRNYLLFGKPVYSTESYDAWVLGYRGDSGEAWHDIYRVYAAELGGPGYPDRSWILRWGLDYTAAKFQTQLNALRDYLLPAWPGLPDLLIDETGRPYLFSRDEEKNLMTPLGAWLSLIGLIGALYARRRLLLLLCMAFAPYMLFLLTYWRTNEERYFLMLMPWLALLIAWIIWAGYDRLAAIGDRRWTPLALILACVAVVSIVQPAWPRIATKVETEPLQWAPDVAAYEWLREHTPPNAVMMTRSPWQLNWHTRRPALMIPNTADRAMLLLLARHYQADYLVLETLQRVKGDAARTLAPLITARDARVGDVIDGFTLVYASPTPDNRVLIYRFPETDE